jgi:hypothetical protein
VTDHRKQVELVLADGARLIVSADEPAAFVDAVRRAAMRAGIRPG